ncbi:MAG: hypothetical protein R3F61_08535 [Myxococcota bacterium]
MLALALLASPASAADGQPGFAGFSARPNDEAFVEASGYGVVVGLPFARGEVATGAMTRGTVRLSERVTADLRAQATRLQGCGVGFDLRCHDDLAVDGTVRLGVAVLDRSSVRVLPYVGAGTTLEAGVAAWWRSRDSRFELDFSWGVAFETLALLPGEPKTWSEVRDPPPNLFVHEIASLPELGLTVHLDQRDLHHLRFGHLAHIPTLTYRVDPGRVGMELTGGVCIAGAVLTGGIAATF